MRRVLLLLVLLVVFVGGASADPSVTSWSNNKTSDADIMFLVSTSDVINFNVIVNESVDYTWSVNKIDQSGNYDNFTFMVPSCSNDTNPSSCIWEIHLNASNGNGIDHHEWVVSTLSVGEAPDFFDYFTDKKTQSRTDTDPWGRALPEWDGDLHVSNAFSSGSSAETFTNSSSVVRGTWKFRYQMPDAGSIPWTGWSLNFWPLFYDSQHEFRWRKGCDSHDHTVIEQDGIEINTGFSTDYDAGIFPNNGWFDITIIRTEDDWWYSYVGEMLKFYVHDDNLTANDVIKFRRTNSGLLINFDMVAVYENKYLFPEFEQTIVYAEWVSNYAGQRSCVTPTKRNGIVIIDKNVTLSDINNTINNASRFTYDSATKTAVCYTDLVIFDGAELFIEDEILKFHCDSDGGLQFAPKYASVLRIKNSTITTTNDHYFVWNNAGATTHYGWSTSLYSKFGTYYDCKPGAGNMAYGCGTGKVDLRSSTSLAHCCYARFVIEDSVINNTAHIFFDSPMELVITSTSITNLHELDIGDYTSASTDRLFAQGAKSFWIMLDEMDIYNFTMNNVTFSGVDTNLTFMTNSYRDRINLYNIDALGMTAEVKKSRNQATGQSYGEVEPPYRAGDTLDSNVGLVNCQFNDYFVSTSNAMVIPKYYLDVKVVDVSGNVGGATVDVTNEVNSDYQTENMVLYHPFAQGAVYGGYYVHYRLVAGEEFNSTTTGATGHTPLPSNVTHTFIAADYVKNQTAQTNFTYNITVSKGVQTATTSGININDSWYRANPETPTMTITCNLSAGTCDMGTSSNGNGWSPSPTAAYFNNTAGYAIEITTKMDGTNIFSRTPTQVDGNATSGRMVVKTT